MCVVNNLYYMVNIRCVYVYEGGREKEREKVRCGDIGIHFKSVLIHLDAFLVSIVETNV